MPVPLEIMRASFLTKQKNALQSEEREEKQKGATAQTRSSLRRKETVQKYSAKTDIHNRRRAIRWPVGGASSDSYAPQQRSLASTPRHLCSQSPAGRRCGGQPAWRLPPSLRPALGRTHTALPGSAQLGLSAPPRWHPCSPPMYMPLTEQPGVPEQHPLASAAVFPGSSVFCTVSHKWETIEQWGSHWKDRHAIKKL